MLNFADPRAQLTSYRREIEAAVRKVLDGNAYIQGPAHDAFEAEFAGFLGARHVRGVASGTDALVLALLACGIQRDEKVIVPSHTAAATISALRIVGAVPSFVDIDPDSYLTSSIAIEEAIDRRTKAIIAVHLYGNMIDAVALRRMADEKGLILIEDCAQATGATWDGARVGSIGHAGCFSFFPTKNLGAIGDGGAIATSDREIADRISQLRTYGWNDQRICVADGINSRLDELQAAILSAKLPGLDADNEKRRTIAARYSKALADLPIALPCDNGAGKHVYHLYVISLDRRNALRDHLKSRGIAAGIHYPVPNHLHPVFKQFVSSPLPKTEQVADRILSLPIYPELSDAQADTVIDAIRSFFLSRNSKA